jgi:hypothetical protein
MKKIPSIKVAQLYIISELSRIFSKNKIQVELARGIKKLPEKSLWRLLESLSFTYRLNSVFWYLSDKSYVWREESVDCATLALTGMNPAIDRVTHSDSIKNNPIKFRDYLAAYFKKYPHDDPKHLEQFRPHGKEIKYPWIILIEKEKKLKMLDGSNRLIAHLLNGGKKIKAIIGRKMGGGKERIGDSTFYLLRRVYEKSAGSDRQAILKTVKILMSLGADGRDAVRSYWVNHARDEKVKKIGRSLLGKNNNKF